RHDPRVLQPRDDLRLATEPAPGLAVLEQLRAHDLHRDEPIQSDIASTVDCAHAAAPDRLLDAVLVVEHARHGARGLHRRTIGRANLHAVVLAAAAARALHHWRQHLLEGARGCGRPIVGAAAKASDIETEAELTRDGREQLTIFGGIGFLGALAAEYQRAD